MEPELGRTLDRANILEDRHRIIQEELANEREFNLSLKADLSRERARRKLLEDKLTDQSEALEAMQRRSRLPPSEPSVASIKGRLIFF